MARIISVSALNAYVRAVLDEDENLNDIALLGEVVNFVHHLKSGHFYFSLRDEKASVKAVMFSRDARQLSFRPENGMRVTVRGRVTLYERDGAYQVYVSHMFPDGIGSVQMAFEQLKSRLEKEGLFLEENKKPLPSRPGCIGLVTSRTGAALQDILTVTQRRWPLVRLLLAPVNVQGQHAPREVAQAVRALDADGRPDLIIVTRGGGSQEDLWVFNDEEIARAVYACRVPVISAVGHEIDYTILDFVADKRAPTPSAAAELAVPDREDVLREIYNLRQNIHKNMQKRLQMCYTKSDSIKRAGAMRAAANGLARREETLRHISDLLRQAAGRPAAQKELRLAHAAQLAHSLDPYAVLARGYGVAQGEDGRVLAVDELAKGQKIRLCGRSRVAECQVNEIKKREDASHEGTAGI